MGRLHGRRVLFLADLHAREAAHARVRTEILHKGADRLLVVLHERLLDERDRLEEAVELALDDLGPRLLGLSLFAGLRLEDRALAFDLVLRHVLAGNEARRRTRDV